MARAQTDRSETGRPPAGGAAIGEPRPGSAAAGRPAIDSLPAGFYARPVLEVARDLVGCVVEHRPTGGGEPPASGVIVETEAYHDSEPACHAFVGLTPRTRTLFGPPGRAYVYRSYGIHALLNAVCEPEGVGAAVLIRALEPLDGIEAMRARRSRGGVGTGIVGGTPIRDEELCSGPGKLTQALGIELSENGADLTRGPVRILPRETTWLEPSIVASTRIGITKAVELPWRFSVMGNRHVSRPRPSEK
jgi:DNA-3-methyladenine glycosylase